MDDNTIITPKFLNDSWVMYFHDPYDIEWDTKSYK